MSGYRRKGDVLSHFFNEGLYRKADHRKHKSKQTRTYLLACVHASLEVHNTRCGMIVMFKGEKTVCPVAPKNGSKHEKNGSATPSYRSSILVDMNTFCTLMVANYRSSRGLNIPAGE